MMLLTIAASGFSMPSSGQVTEHCPSAEALLNPAVVLPGLEQGQSAFLVRCGLDINRPMMLDGAPVRPIDLAAADPDPALAEQVLRAGARPNDDGGPELGIFPLDTALSAHNLDTARMLMRHGARADYQQPLSGMTALMAIAFWEDSGHDYEAIVSTLILHGAQLDAVDRHGDSALHWAARLNNTSLAGVLLAHGAQACMVNKKGLTPARMMKAPGLSGLAKQLQERCGARTAARRLNQPAKVRD